MVVISTDLTAVLKLPTFAPSWLRSGLPSFIMARSLVVPPISTTIQFCFPLILTPPITLAAGPESKVSTGLSFTNSSDIMLPSPHTIANGALMPLSFRATFTASINSSISGINLAFNSAVAPRFRKFSWLDSSCPHTTGNPVASPIRDFAFCSNSGFRMPHICTTAKASTFPVSLFILPISSSQSGSAITSPRESCPPARNIISSIAGKPYWDPFLATTSLSQPIKISFALLPLSSTQALVARVVDKDTMPTLSNRSLGI